MTQVTIVRELDGKELITFYPPDQVPMVPLLKFTIKVQDAAILTIGHRIIVKIDNNVGPTMTNKEIFHAKGYINDIQGIATIGLFDVFLFLEEIIYHVPANNHITAYDRAMAIVKQ